MRQNCGKSTGLPTYLYLKVIEWRSGEDEEDAEAIKKPSHCGTCGHPGEVERGEILKPITVNLGSR